MTKTMIDLPSVIAKSDDTDFLHDLIQDAAQRLGTKDQRSASILTGRITVEFDRMMSSLILLSPALPEEVVSQYMATSLRQVLPEFHRKVRIERMTGRGLQDGAWLRDIQKLAVLTLLEDGVHSTFPPHRIDPAWTPEQVEHVLRIYQIEYARIMSPEARQTMVKRFTETTGTPMNSMEHHAQVREADLKVRLVRTAVQKLATEVA